MSRQSGGCSIANSSSLLQNYCNPRAESKAGGMPLNLTLKSTMQDLQLEQVVARLRGLSSPEKIALKQQKFGITARNSLGIYHRDLKLLAKEIGRNNALALELYDTGIYEARLLCSKIYDPTLISEAQMNRWVADFENWEICDSFCMGFFVKSDFALEKAFEWSTAEEEFIKRAGFAMMAAYGFAHKKAENAVFLEFLDPIYREADDDRIYVKKAVNWALRNIGKRNGDLRVEALATAERILLKGGKAAQWVAKNAIAELSREGINVLDYPRAIYRPN